MEFASPKWSSFCLLIFGYLLPLFFYFRPSRFLTWSSFMGNRSVWIRYLLEKLVLSLLLSLVCVVYYKHENVNIGILYELSYLFVHFWIEVVFYSILICVAFVVEIINEMEPSLINSWLLWVSLTTTSGGMLILLFLKTIGL